MALDATVGGVNANSYMTVVEAQAYFDTRLPVLGWDAGDSEALLIQATRVMEALFSPTRKLMRPSPPAMPYYLIRPTWTGAPASTTQRLLWPRIGMFSRTGVAIPTTVIPQELKDALAELAGQLGNADRTLDNDVSVQGITAVRAGSVSVNFKNEIDATKVIPDIVFQMLVPSWLTDEIVEPAIRAQFDVISS